MPTTSTGLRRIAADLQRRDGVEAILLAGTDLTVIFDEATAGFPCIDVARVHIDAIVERLRRHDAVIDGRALKRLPHADDLAEAAADMVGRVGRQPLDLDLDRQSRSSAAWAKTRAGTRPRLARSSSARGSTPGSASASKQYRTVEELRLRASTADMERLLE